MLIKEMWAYIIVDPNGEGIPAVKGPDGSFLPMIGTDREIMVEMSYIAQHVSTQAGLPIKLVRFTYEETVDVVKPEAGSGSFTPAASEIYH